MMLHVYMILNFHRYAPLSKAADDDDDIELSIYEKQWMLVVFCDCDVVFVPLENSLLTIQAFPQ